MASHLGDQTVLLVYQSGKNSFEKESEKKKISQINFLQIPSIHLFKNCNLHKGKDQVSLLHCIIRA